MSSVMATSLSGMQAAQSALDVAAHNIANAQTPGFRRQPSPQALASDGGEALATDLVGQLVAKNAFLANLAVFKAADQMAGTLLDVRG